jgi:hypothetical protein
MNQDEYSHGSAAGAAIRIATPTNKPTLTAHHSMVF